MLTETSTKEELLASIGEAVSDMAGLMEPLSETQVNTVPYEGSWTAGQLFSHVTKSINGMGGAMLKESAVAERDPGEKIEGLRKTFLDLSTKFKSPDFIIPDDGPYQKQVTIEALKSSFELLKGNTSKSNLNDLLKGLPIGEVTKLELLHFILYHTQRHLQQMKKISDTLQH